LLDRHPIAYFKRVSRAAHSANSQSRYHGAGRTRRASFASSRREG
jgi:hypothetical protein